MQNLYSTSSTSYAHSRTENLHSDLNENMHSSVCKKVLKMKSQMFWMKFFNDTIMMLIREQCVQLHCNLEQKESLYSLLRCVKVNETNFVVLPVKQTKCSTLTCIHTQTHTEHTNTNSHTEPYGRVCFEWIQWYETDETSISVYCFWSCEQCYLYNMGRAYREYVFYTYSTVHCADWVLAREEENPCYQCQCCRCRLSVCALHSTQIHTCLYLPIAFQCVSMCIVHVLNSIV